MLQEISGKFDFDLTSKDATKNSSRIINDCGRTSFFYLMLILFFFICFIHLFASNQDCSLKDSLEKLLYLIVLSSGFFFKVLQSGNYSVFKEICVKNLKIRRKWIFCTVKYTFFGSANSNLANTIYIKVGNVFWKFSVSDRWI